jgi:dihydroxyacetone kinase
MLTDTLKLPSALDVAEGDNFTLEVSGVAVNGQIIVKKMIQKSPEKSDRQQAVDLFIQKWTGAFAASGPLQDLDEVRWAAMKEKHSL